MPIELCSIIRFLLVIDGRLSPQLYYDVDTEPLRDFVTVSDDSFADSALWISPALVRSASDAAASNKARFSSKSLRPNILHSSMQCFKSARCSAVLHRESWRSELSSNDCLASVMAAHSELKTLTLAVLLLCTDGSSSAIKQSRSLRKYRSCTACSVRVLWWSAMSAIAVIDLLVDEVC